MLTRWASADHDSCPARRLSTLTVPLITEDSPELPSLQAIVESQNLHPPTRNSSFTLMEIDDVKVWENNNGKCTSRRRTQNYNYAYVSLRTVALEATAGAQLPNPLSEKSSYGRR